jgi:two-component system cell cycle sensor histidine kinase/response regulator CckA
VTSKSAHEQANAASGERALPPACPERCEIPPTADGNALAENEQRYRSLVDSVVDHAIFLLDRDGKVASWNPGAEAIKGYRADEILGRPMATFYTPEDLAVGVPQRALLVARTEGRFTAEGWRVRADGTRFWASVVLTSLWDARGGLSGYSKVTRDLSHQRAIEEALRQSEQRYRQVLEDQTEVVCRFRADGTFTFVNEVYCRTFGRTAEQLLGHRWHPVVAPEDLPQVEAMLATMSAHNPVVRIENRVLDGQGRVRWMEFVNRGFHDPDGTLREVQAVGRDVTERREAEQAARELERSLREQERQRDHERQLLQSQKLESLGVLAGGVAHDFNNLLTAILGHASLARMNLPAEHPVAGELALIEAASLRAAELCQQMLAYAGRGRFLIAPTDVNALAREMTKLLGAAIPKHVALRFDLAPGLPPVDADATQLRQVVMNLITNAAEAIGRRGGTVAVATRGETDDDGAAHVVFEVSDDGCGMDDALRARIFEPFFTTKFQGRGLGLAAVQGIVRAHRGTIDVTSQPGAGSTFRVRLPATGVAIAPTASAGEAPVAAPGSKASGRGRRVLVVDDEAEVRTLLRRTLEQCGYHVVVANDGEEALAAFEREGGEFAVVVLDLTMPRLSGPETFRRLRERNATVPVLLTSGYAQEEALREFGQGELAGFLRKPFRPQQLLTAMFATVGP